MLASTREGFQTFIMNPLFLSSLSGWLCAQFIKTVISLLQGKITDIKDLIASLIWKTGGMPSSHSSLVCALSTSIGFSAGVNSDIFILSMCFTLVVIRDALGVRRASGMQARAINELGEELKSKNIVNFKPIKEVHGHKPLEVAIGCLLGFFTGMAFSVL